MNIIKYSRRALIHYRYIYVYNIYCFLSRENKYNKVTPLKLYAFVLYVLYSYIYIVLTFTVFCVLFYF